MQQPDLRRQLAALRFRLRLCRALQGLAATVGICGLAWAAARFGAPHLAQEGQTATQAALAALFLVLAARLIAWPLLRPLPLLQMALLVERRFPRLQDLLATAVQFSVGFAPLSSASAALATQAVERADAELGALPVRDVLPLAALRRAQIATVVGICTVVFALLAGPRASARLQPQAAAPQPQMVAEEREIPRAEPTIHDVSVQITPPRYTGLLPEKRDSGYESLTVCSGSVISIIGKCDNATASEVRIASESHLNETNPGDIRAQFTALRDTSWQIVARSTDGQTARIGPCAVKVTRDAPPSVKIVRPGRDLALEALIPVEIGITADDDYGISRVELQYRPLGAKDWRAQPVEGSGRAFSAAFRWDLAPMNIQPGGGIEYRAVAWDNDTVTGPKSAASSIYRITVKPLPNLPPQQAIEQAQKVEEEAVSNLEAEAKDIDKTLDDLMHRAEGGQMSPAETAQAQAELKSAQERMQRLADKMREAIAKMEQTLKLGDLVTPEMQEKVAELHKLMQEILDKDMKALMERMDAALRKTAPDALKGTLEDAQKLQRKFVDKLEQTLALLKRAKLEAELGELRAQVEKLAQRQKEAREATRGTADFDRQTSRQQAQKQSDLARDTSPVPEKVSDLAGKMAEVSPEAAGRLDRLQSALEQQNPAGKMRQATQSLQDGRSSDALGPQQQAQQSLEDAAAQLAGAEADMNGEMRRELTAAAQKMTRDALYLSEEQTRVMQEAGELGDRTRQAPLTSKRRLDKADRDQQAVQEGVDGLSQRMRDLSAKTPLMDPDLAGQAAQASAEMEQAQQNMEAGALPMAQALQGRARQELNDLAQQLLSMADKFSKASAQQELSEYMKRLEALAKQQQSLNDQTQQQAGSEGTPTPGQGSLSELGMEQALLRQALQRLMQGAQKGGEGQTLGQQLGNVPGQMKDVEGDLEGARVTPKTVQTQRDILHKMMDAQRSLYTKKQESKERIAERPKPYIPAQSPPRLLPSQLAPPQVNVERKEMTEQGLPLDYETLVKRYFGETAGTAGTAGFRDGRF